MKIERISSKPRITIERFAEEHDLVMQVQEPRSSAGSPGLNGQFRACFKGVEIAEDGMLCGVSACGPTEADAINAYANQISGKTIRLYSGKRIKVPDLLGYINW